MTESPVHPLTHPTRPRGIEVLPIDLTVTESYKLYGDIPHALAATDDGKRYILCNEGVGKEITDEEYDYYYKVGDAAKYEFVNLADFIRVFGTRLETNFYAWYYRLGGEHCLDNSTI